MIILCPLCSLFSNGADCRHVWRWPKHTRCSQQSLAIFSHFLNKNIPVVTKVIWQGFKIWIILFLGSLYCIAFVLCQNDYGSGPVGPFQGRKPLKTSSRVQFMLPILRGSFVVRWATWVLRDSGCLPHDHANYNMVHVMMPAVLFSYWFTSNVSLSFYYSVWRTPACTTKSNMQSVIWPWKVESQF